MLLVLAFICGMHTLAFGHARYHLPVIPLVLVYTASAVAHRRDIRQRRRSRPFRLSCGLCAVFMVGWLWQLIVVDSERLFRLLHLSA